MIATSIYSKDEIIKAFEEVAHSANEFFASLDDDKLHDKPEGKWSAAENFEHLFVSTYPVSKGLGYPKLTYMAFGTNKGKSRSYDELIAIYNAKLEEGAKATGKFIPEDDKNLDKDTLISKWKKSTDTFLDKIKGWSEADLDKYRMPHPLLGKLTVREMLFFTIHHIQHHHQIVKSRWDVA